MERKKRILIVNQYFYPENFRINDLAFELAKEGNEVDVLTGIPNYPEGSYFSGYGIFKNRYEVVNGVKIYRCFHTPRGKKAGNLMLSINYLTYMLSACLHILFHFAWKKKYDAVICYCMSPVTQAIPACLLGSLRKTKILTWIQDIWPDSITDNINKTQEKFLIPPLNIITDLVYKGSSKILISSKGMDNLINRRHNYFEKIEYVPNWCDDFSKGKIEPVDEMPSSGFNLVMAGTLGLGIGIDSVIHFVEEMSDCKDVNIVFVGGGAKMEYLRDYFKKHNLTNAYVLGRFPFSMMPSFYAKADAMFLSLMGETQEYLDVTVPSRLQSYMSAGKPIFAMIGSGATEVINSANCGFAVPAGDYKSLAQLVKQNYKNKDLLNELGRNSRLAYEKEFTLNAGVAHFKDLINNP